MNNPMQSTGSILIIGIGNEYRGDDAVGLYVARELAKLDPEGCVVKECPGEGTYLLNSWEGYRNVIIIDAVKSLSAPGNIRRVDATSQDLPVHWVHRSAHSVSLAEAIKLSRALETLPDSLVIYGIEGDNFDPGEELSDRVSLAAEKLVSTILDEIKTLG